MNESIDRVVADWLDEGPERGPREGLERTLAATRRVGQRPGWTISERWLPMQLTMTRTASQRPIFAALTMALLIGALFASALYIGSQRGLPDSPFRNGAIVYAQDGDLFIADQLGGTSRPLVAGPEGDLNPVFSPSGDRVAFVRDTRAGRSVMAVDPDGSGVTLLASGFESPDSEGMLPTNSRAPALALAWAPDGSALLATGSGRDVVSGDGQVAIGVDREGRRLYVIESDGSGVRIIDAGPDGAVGSGSWRPDGRHIAFTGLRDGARVAFIADADGSNVRPIITEPGGNTNEWVSGQEWSPDGTQLVFSGSRPGIVDIDADGTMTGWHALPLEPGEIVASAAKWSPDGSGVAFILYVGSDLKVGVFEPDGSGYRTLGPAIVDRGDAAFAWAPDGRSLLIADSVLRQDPDTLTYRWEATTWSVDVATGVQMEVRTPVGSWQRLSP